MSSDDLIVRGGVMGYDSMLANVQAHFHAPPTEGEWALSVASLPGEPVDEIVRAAKTITQNKYQVARAGDLAAAGFVPVADRHPVAPAHCLVLLPREFDEGMWQSLRALFPVEGVNPYAEERKRRGGW